MAGVAEDEGAKSTDRWDALAEFYGSSPVVARLAKVLVDIVGVSPGELVIDLGTGTGLDRSFGMLKVAAGRAAEAALANVGLVRADAARIPVPDANFDVALAASVWQFLGCSPEVLAEWRRVLRPGGRLGFSVPGPGSGASIPADLMAKYCPRPAPPAQERPVSQESPGPLPDLAEAATTGGFSEARVLCRSWDHILPRAEDWWALQWAHGVRFFLEKLDPESLEMLKGESLERLARTGSGEIVVTTNTLYCVSWRRGLTEDKNRDHERVTPCRMPARAETTSVLNLCCSTSRIGVGQRFGNRRYVRILTVTPAFFVHSYQTFGSRHPAASGGAARNHVYGGSSGVSEGAELDLDNFARGRFGLSGRIDELDDMEKVAWHLRLMAAAGGKIVSSALLP
jgi:SAM-dependent methyltransferase